MAIIAVGGDLFDINGNILIEGIYSTKGSADEKANYYLKYYRNNINFYSIDEAPLNQNLSNENVINKLYLSF